MIPLILVLAPSTLAAIAWLTVFISRADDKRQKAIDEATAYSLAEAEESEPEPAPTA